MGGRWIGRSLGLFWESGRGVEFGAKWNPKDVGRLCVVDTCTVEFDLTLTGLGIDGLNLKLLNGFLKEIF